MIELVQKHIQNTFPAHKRFLLACSAGIDSMCLASIFYFLQIPFRLIHVNYGLRGRESDLDEAFLFDWAAKRKLELIVGNAKEDMALEFGNIQQRARSWRYTFFNSHLKEEEVLVTAHQLDDQLEGFFIGLKRREKWESLAGMTIWNGLVFRPFLSISREEISSFARSNDIDWREDSSNSSLKYVRNRIRNTLIPALDKVSEEWRSDTADIQHFLNKGKEEKEDRVEKWTSQYSQIKPNCIEFDPAGFEDGRLDLAIAFLRKFGKLDVDSFKNILKKSGKYILIGQHRFEVCTSKYLLAENAPINFRPIDFELGEKTLDSNFKVNCSMETKVGSEELDPMMAYIDLDKLVNPLYWRHPQNGDRFFPIGMKGSKKISDYLNEKGLSLLEKKNIWLLTSADSVVWIAGYRIDRRFAANDQTSKAYFVRLTQEVFQ